jgi:hypothetical protein
MWNQLSDIGFRHRPREAKIKNELSSTEETLLSVSFTSPILCTGNYTDFFEEIGEALKRGESKGSDARPTWPPVAMADEL